MMRALACGVALVALAGCAGPTLDVGYPDAASNRALLASVAPRKIVVSAVNDRRADQSRIGVEPVDGKAIATARSVPDIIRDAVVLELTKNGHEVVAGGGDALVAVDVEEFWLDAVGRSAATQYVGRVAIALLVADGRTGDRLLTRRYVGISRRTADAKSEDTWRQVMDTALARTVHDVATDPEVARTVGRTPPR
jgi:uncharacterized lipoprotein YajG